MHLAYHQVNNHSNATSKNNLNFDLKMIFIHSKIGPLKKIESSCDLVSGLGLRGALNSLIIWSTAYLLPWSKPCSLKTCSTTNLGSAKMSSSLNVYSFHIGLDSCCCCEGWGYRAKAKQLIGVILDMVLAHSLIRGVLIQSCSAGAKSFHQLCILSCTIQWCYPKCWKSLCH